MYVYITIRNEMNLNVCNEYSSIVNISIGNTRLIDITAKRTTM